MAPPEVMAERATSLSYSREQRTGRRHTKREVKKTVYTLLTPHFPQPCPFQGSKANFGRATAGGGPHFAARWGQSCHELLKETVEESDGPAGRTQGSAEGAPRDQCAALTPHVEDPRQHAQRQGNILRTHGALLSTP